MSVARRGAHLAAECSEEERSGAKWRGRGLVQRNTNLANLNVYLRVKQTFS